MGSVHRSTSPSNNLRGLDAKADAKSNKKAPPPPPYPRKSALSTPKKTITNTSVVAATNPAGRRSRSNSPAMLPQRSTYHRGVAPMYPLPMLMGGTADPLRNSDDLAVPTDAPIFVNTIDGCIDLATKIIRDATYCAGAAAIGVDCEGVNLGRDGELCIVTIATRDNVYLIDTHILGKEAFTSGELGLVLENKRIVKYFFDCRQDADALHHHFGVKLKNVVDLQYSASKFFNVHKDYVISFKRAIEALGCASAEELKIKVAGNEFFCPAKGGSFDNWKMRPLPKLLVKYSALDVKYFFLLAECGRLHEADARSVGTMRVQKAESRNFKKAFDGSSDWNHLFCK